jgi:hypothetical protein
MPNMKTLVKRFCSYLANKLFLVKAFEVKAPLTLTFDTVTSNRAHRTVITNVHAKCQRNLKLLGGQAFLVKTHVTFTFDPVTSIMIIDRVHLIIMTNLHAKYKDCWSKDY